jgi:hypothetical protein
VVDVFEEVDEQFRSDHYKVLARRYLPWIGGALVLALVVALGLWGYTRYQVTSAQKASETYAQGLESLTRGDVAQAYNIFGEAAKSPSAAYRSLALMQQAGVRVGQNRIAEAVKLFDAAAKAAPNPVLADVAGLKAAMTLMDAGETAQVEARLKPLTDSKRPYAALAREALAIDKLMTGRANEARSDFVVLSLMADAPEDVRERAKIAMAMIDGNGVGGLRAIVKAAHALPPAAPSADAAPGAAGPDSETPQAGAAQ